jgi:hypothetical protein
MAWMEGRLVSWESGSEELMLPRCAGRADCVSALSALSDV